jgi:hypothetical protein
LGVSQATNYYFESWNNSKQLKNDPFITLADGKRERGFWEWLLFRVRTLLLHWQRERGFWEWLLFRVRMLYYIGRWEEDRLFTIYLLNNKHNHSSKINIIFI